MRDAQADIGRRAWTSCPRCPVAASCAACDTGRNCDAHWCFLLAAEGRRLFVQCPGCWHRWWHDTGFGAGDRPHAVDRVPYFPTAGSATA
ncbi:hypothetical protein [Pseudonocardia nigra]|uniref:hypothetical protein n=1 Tax=Pseudonocardia nigra TaxID=1921578 RepID=UPI001C5F450A|nr:hypothetical protein [Pseudonocardia nigra]